MGSSPIETTITEPTTTGWIARPQGRRNPRAIIALFAAAVALTAFAAAGATGAEVVSEPIAPVTAAP